MDAIKKNRRRQQKAKGILDRAVRMIADDGIESFALRRLARELDITTTAIYSHFPSRDDLLRALTDRGYLEIAGVLQRSTAEKAAGEQLVWFGAAYVNYAMNRPDMFKMLFMSPLFDHIEQSATLERGATNEDALALLVDLISQLPLKTTSTSALDLAHQFWALMHGVAAIYVSLAHDPWFEFKRPLEIFFRLSRTWIKGLGLPFPKALPSENKLNQFLNEQLEGDS